MCAFQQPFAAAFAASPSLASAASTRLPPALCASSGASSHLLTSKTPSQVLASWWPLFPLVHFAPFTMNCLASPKCTTASADYLRRAFTIVDHLRLDRLRRPWPPLLRRQVHASELHSHQSSMETRLLRTVRHSREHAFVRALLALQTWPQTPPVFSSLQLRRPCLIRPQHRAMARMPHSLSSVGILVLPG